MAKKCFKVIVKFTITRNTFFDRLRKKNCDEVRVSNKLQPQLNFEKQQMLRCRWVHWIASAERREAERARTRVTPTRIYKLLFHPASLIFLKVFVALTIPMLYFFLIFINEFLGINDDPSCWVCDAKQREKWEKDGNCIWRAPAWRGGAVDQKPVGDRRVIHVCVCVCVVGGGTYIRAATRACL